MRYLIVLLALAGIIDSFLALRIHYMDPNAAPPCAVSAHFDCGTVNHSKYAVFPPPTSFDEDPNAPGSHRIPVAAIGIAGYILILALALFGRMWWTLQAAQIGFFCAAMLSYLEAFVIQSWCIYCLWSQGIITAIVLATIVWIILDRRKRFAHNTEHSAVVIAHE